MTSKHFHPFHPISPWLLLPILALSTWALRAAYSQPVRPPAAENAPETKAPAEKTPADKSAADPAKAADPAGKADSPPAEATPPAVERPADPLLAEAAAKLAQVEWLQARVRQRIELFDNRLDGVGAYMKGPGQKMRLELKISLDDRQAPSSLLQVCDGRWLWDHRDVLGSRTLTKVDVTVVRDALARAQRPSEELARQTSLFQNHIGLGGLEEMLRRLSSQFHFYQVDDVTLGADRRTALVGLWTRPLLLHMLPDQKVAIEAGTSPDLTRLAPHVPDHVVLLLGPDDLFPYRVEFRRSTASQPSTTRLPPSSPLVVMELFDVRFGQPLDELHFFYKSDLLATDRTQSYLRDLGLPAK